MLGPTTDDLAATDRTPRVSVVMTAYTDLRFIEAAVESILQQTFRDFELIIVDDGSGQDAAVRDLAARDSRIRLLFNERNLGTAAAANRGIAASRGAIIARLDADDIAEPERLSRLVEALDADPGLGLIGSDVIFIDEAGAVIGQDRMPTTDLAVRWTILFHNPFYHSAVAFRRTCFETAGRYRPDELVSQDHYLWFDMLPHCRARNIPEFLTRYRINPQGLTALNTASGRRRTHAIREAQWRAIGLVYDLHDDAVARPLTAFLRGHDIAPVLRADSYRTLLHVLRHFLAAQRLRGVDAEAARSLKQHLLTRMLAAPPPHRADRLRLLVQGLWSAPAASWSAWQRARRSI